MTGFNLPPGCNVSDIPGNRPEDQMWEHITTEFWNKCPDQDWMKFDKANLGDELVDLVEKAIQYGIDLGWKQCKEDKIEAEAEQKEYDRYHKVPKLRAYFKMLRKYRSALKILVPATFEYTNQRLLDEELRKCLKSE